LKDQIQADAAQARLLLA